MQKSVINKLFVILFQTYGGGGVLYVKWSHC